jgi:hypothetical protein
MDKMTYATYFWSVLGFLLVVGAILYVLDRFAGTAIKRFFWALTHDKRTRMPDHLRTGFIFGQHIRTRAKVAAFIALGETALSITFGNVNPFLEIITSIIDIPVLLAGFYLGPILLRLLGVADAVLERVEDVELRIEKGETTLGSEVRGVAGVVNERARARFDDVIDRAQETIKPYRVDTSAGRPDSVIPTPPPEPEPDPQEGFDNFLGKRKK